MPLTNEIMFIYQACKQLTNNMIELRNDVNTLKEKLAVVKEIASRRDNITQSSVVDYRNLPNEFKASCQKYLSTYLRQKHIPLDRCVNFWLEDELMKHHYYSKRQTKERKISKETAPSVASAINSLDAQSDFDVNNCFEGISSPQSPKRRAFSH
ncbi:hypothetical protein BD560DRAFT_422526 [Blakeslea trispora]|nr:hypothetical protein BD560DRAFT_422526 [Blakeslea trispora]